MNKLRADIVPLLENIDITDEPLKLSDEDRKMFLNRFKEGNEKVAHTYLKKDLDLFKMVETKIISHHEDPLRINMQTAVKIASKLWMKKQEKYNSLMNENLFLKCELLLEKDEFDEAEIAIHEYGRLYPNNPKRHYLKSKLLYKTNEINLAISEISLALEKNGTNSKFKNFHIFLQKLVNKG